MSDILKLIYYQEGSVPQSAELVETANNILQERDNIRLLINLVNFREFIAQVHIASMLELKSRTKELIDSYRKPSPVGPSNS